MRSPIILTVLLAGALMHPTITNAGGIIDPADKQRGARVETAETAHLLAPVPDEIPAWATVKIVVAGIEVTCHWHVTE
jgi:hypothetical protein